METFLNQSPYAIPGMNFDVVESIALNIVLYDRHYQSLYSPCFRLDLSLCYTLSISSTNLSELMQKYVSVVSSFNVSCFNCF